MPGIISSLKKMTAFLTLATLTTPVIAREKDNSVRFPIKVDAPAVLIPGLIRDLNIKRFSRTILLNSVFSKESVSFDDLGDEYIVVKNIPFGTTTDIKLDLQLLFSTGQGTGKKMTISTTGLSGIAPECAEIGATLPIPGKVDCYGTFENRRVYIGSAGSSADSCVTTKRPIYRNEEVCEGSPKICETNWRPFCEDRYKIECETREILDHYEYDTDCTTKTYTANFQVSSFQALNNSQINSRLIFESLHAHVRKTHNSNTVSNVSTTSMQGEKRDINSVFHFGLYCEDGRAIGSTFNEGQNSYGFAYEDIYSVCGDQAVHLKSNRAIHFNVGQLVFTFDN
ncbi:MAG TPA: hypothetical protein VE954_08760 [Oligoflexus sp.]|uniref:hypothetical protein n=1 Tax=Oligoflexus sp. TaxID=1971216 RepID=UPI002D589664|nr:hypothetical protein [Oligoflexus sp.]HYX33193.1 hypothetical protein [Oligoflexus sp.]